jgi:hypothetical protein
MVYGVWCMVYGVLSYCPTTTRLTWHTMQFIDVAHNAQSIAILHIQAPHATAWHEMQRSPPLAEPTSQLLRPPRLLRIRQQRRRRRLRNRHHGRCVTPHCLLPPLSSLHSLRPPHSPLPPLTTLSTSSSPRTLTPTLHSPRFVTN